MVGQVGIPGMSHQPLLPEPPVLTLGQAAAEARCGEGAVGGRQHRAQSDSTASGEHEAGGLSGRRALPMLRGAVGHDAAAAVGVEDRGRREAPSQNPYL